MRRITYVRPLDDRRPVGASQRQHLTVHIGPLDRTRPDVGDAAHDAAAVGGAHVDLLAVDVAFQPVQEGQVGTPHGRAVGVEGVSGGIHTCSCLVYMYVHCSDDIYTAYTIHDTLLSSQCRRPSRSADPAQLFN